MAVNPVRETMHNQLQAGGKKYVVVGDTGFLMNQKRICVVMIGYDINQKKKLYALQLAN